ncbi:hypothetical protein BpHYR1_038250 [Brachionus plicatilis]|uniref:Uncharacterized protein n=1 Tax=Brachionus plicatilis TaxID=10195 RepID=A0A3M7PW67_BRAPC|nr:hypothetical protein BpHYR1_038250 [Brachionus plicatilis]
MKCHFSTQYEKVTKYGAKLSDERWRLEKDKKNLSEKKDTKDGDERWRLEKDKKNLSEKKDAKNGDERWRLDGAMIRDKKEFV